MAVLTTSAALFFLLRLSFLFTSSHSLDCNAGDRAALLRVKEQFGDPFGQFSAWQPATNCCDWTNGDNIFLYCNDDGRIDSLAFFRLNHSVPIPPALGDLSELVVLQIEDSPGITGPIPSTFTKLSKLQILWLDGNSIAGTIPTFLTTINLTSLIMSENKLSGPIPTAFAEFPNLEVLDLGGNRLTGQIPPGLLTGEPRRWLNLSDNRLTGTIPRDYGDRDILTFIVSHNSLVGDPSFLFGILKPATWIDLSFNKFAFDMTKVMFPHHLTHLDLSHNRITGQVAKSLKGIDLSFFNVSYNELCGEIPTGTFMAKHGADSYIHNKCLCGTPLPPCNGKAAP